MAQARARILFALVLLHGLSAVRVYAADFFVAPTGSDTNPGTLDRPFASVGRAEQAASPGDTVYLRGGVYRFSGSQATVGVAFTKSGTQDKPIRYFAYQGEVPIFDLFELKPQARVTGLDLRCDWVHLRGLEVRGVRQLIVGDSWSVRVRGNHNVLELLNVHDGQAPGIFITSGASNLVLNCDSHHNYDPLEDGGNADGFGCHSSGGNNVLRGCRAYENSDDGFDFINAPGTCTVEGSMAFRNGYIPDTNNAGANGAGFKAGGFGEPPNVPAGGAPRHVVRGNVSFGNRAIGVYANHHPGGIDFYNNISFDNPTNFDMLPPSTGGATPHKLRNNIAAGSGRAIANLSGGGSDSVNSWTLPVMVTAADFRSMDKALARAPRRADGSLPDNAFMRLVEGSDLIDRGEDVGLPFVGKKPDLGAFEFGAVSDAGPEPADAGASSDASAASDAAAADAGDTDAAASRDAGSGGPSTPTTDAGADPSAPGSNAGSAGAPTSSGDASTANGADAGSDIHDAGSLTRNEAGVIAEEPDESSSGCSLRPPVSRGGAALLLLLALVPIRRRRRPAPRVV